MRDQTALCVTVKGTVGDCVCGVFRSRERDWVIVCVVFSDHGKGTVDDCVTDQGKGTVDDCVCGVFRSRERDSG